MVLGAEDVGIVLGEVAHAHDAVQRAGRLIAMYLAEFGELERQVAVGLEPVPENLHMAGTIHRLAAIDLLVRSFRDVHIFAELLPMAGLLPQDPLHHFRRVHLDEAVSILAAADIVHQSLEQVQPLGCQNTAPCASSWKWNRSISRPSRRWSRFSASSSM